MVASIGAIASAAQGVSYYERDGYYANDDPAHKEASRWAGQGATELGLAGPVDPDAFKEILEGRVPDGNGHRLGRKGKDGTLSHRPGRDVTLSAPKSVSLAALIGGDKRIVTAHDKAVERTLAWVEKKRRGNPFERSAEGPHGPRRWPEDGSGDVPPRHLPQPRPPASHPRGHRQHAPGRGRQMAHDGQRKALSVENADRRALPRRTGG